MRRPLMVAAVIMLAVVITGSSYVATRANSQVLSNAHRALATGGDTTKGFYLDIGASASLGIQPNGIPASNAHRTKTGYANDIVTLEHAKGVDLELQQVGCAGETAQSMLGKAHHCYKKPNRQLVIATQYLVAHHDQIGLVTIDLGFNNVRTCLWPTVSESCVAQGLAYVSRDLPRVLTALKKVAGPKVHFVGIEYADPFLANYLKGPEGVVQATLSLTAMNQLNRVLQSVFVAAQISVANVAGAFKSASTSPTTTANVGTVPTNVAVVCAKTWMCQSPPWGPDDHPNNAGYLLIATAVAAAGPKVW